MQSIDNLILNNQFSKVLVKKFKYLKINRLNIYNVLKMVLLVW